MFFPLNESFMSENCPWCHWYNEWQNDGDGEAYGACLHAIDEVHTEETWYECG